MGSYTQIDCFKKSTPPSTIHLIYKGLEKRTRTEFLHPKYLLVYTHKEFPQPSNVHLSTSVFVSNQKIAYIIHLPFCIEGMSLRI